MLLLSLLLVALAATTELSASWTSDDASYAVAARLVRDHDTWMYPADPAWAEGLSEPALVNGTVTDDGLFPYVRQPLWVMALVASSSLVPEPHGLYVWSMLGSLLGAVMAGIVVRRIMPEAAALAFWTVGLAPSIVWAFGLWAHAPMVALGGVMAWGLTRLSSNTDRFDPGAVFAMAAAGALGVALRSEGLVMVGSAAVASAWVIWTGGGEQRLRRLGASALAILLAGFVARLVSAAQAAEIATASALPPTGGADGSWLTGRVSGALATVATTTAAPTAAFLSGVLAIVVAAIVGLRVVETGRIDRLVVALSLAWVAIAATRSVLFPLAHLSGTLAAAPLVTAGLVSFRWNRATHAARALVVYSSVFVATVLAVQYDVGGGHEWGGRFLSGALVPLAVVACVSLMGHLGSVRRTSAVAELAPGRRVAGALVALALLGAPALIATAVTWHGRGLNHAWTSHVEKAGSPIVLTLDRVGTHIGWRTTPEVHWVRVLPDDLTEVLGGAVAAGESDLVVFGAPVEAVSGFDCEVDPLTPRILHLRC